MARQLFDIGIYSVLTSGGAIGAGWKLNFYQGGTSTRITTYNARTAGSANANPVVADANGRFDEIWIEADQTIKWVLTDASDTVKVTVDDFLIPDDPATVAASLETFLAGSAALPVANGGTGATSAANARTNLEVLALAGGTVTGNITRSTKGPHLYFAATAMANPIVHLTTTAAADPTSAAGEIWMKY